MKLNSKTIKLEFFTSPVLLKNLSVEERMIFLGMILLAESSGCLEDEMLEVKRAFFPLDDKPSLKDIEKTRDKLIEIGELVRYKIDKKNYLFISNIDKWQPNNRCSPPSLPLPFWVKWERFPSTKYKGRYLINKDYIGKEPPEDISKVWPEEELFEEEKTSAEKPKPSPTPRPAVKPEYTPEFEDFWQAYPRKIEKKRAFAVWKTRLREKYKAEDLINAAYNYAALCKMRGTEEAYIKHPATFIGPSLAFEEFIDGIPENLRVQAVKSKKKSNVEKGLELVKQFEEEENAPNSPF